MDRFHVRPFEQGTDVTTVDVLVKVSLLPGLPIGGFIAPGYSGVPRSKRCRSPVGRPELTFRGIHGLLLLNTLRSQLLMATDFSVESVQLLAFDPLATATATATSVSAAVIVASVAASIAFVSAALAATVLYLRYVVLSDPVYIPHPESSNRHNRVSDNNQQSMLMSKLLPEAVDEMYPESPQPSEQHGALRRTFYRYQELHGGLQYS